MFSESLINLNIKTTETMKTYLINMQYLSLSGSITKYSKTYPANPICSTCDCGDIFGLTTPPIL